MSVIFSIIGYFVILFSVYYSSFSEGEEKPIAYIIHKPSIVLVGLGLIGIWMIINHYKDIYEIFKILLTESSSKIRDKIHFANKNWEDLTNSSYSQDHSKITDFSNNKKMPQVFRKSLKKLEAKIDPEDIKQLLQRDCQLYDGDMSEHINSLNKLSEMAPSLGMFGTVLGLIKLLADLSDYSAIGANMSLALITTLYGIFFSNMIINPFISRFENIKNAKLKSYEQTYFWLEILQNHKPAFYLNQNFKIQKKDSKNASS